MNQIFNYTDDELIKLREKYHEKQIRYSKMYNETTERNERILFHIEKEILNRYISKNLDIIINKMDLTE
jgi:FixJ family two-component response regulator